MVSFRTHLSAAGYGLAGLYAALGLLELILGGAARSALSFLVGAAVTAGIVTVLLPLLAPRGGDDDDDDDGHGGGGDGDGPPPPPWWPDFEREFWGHVGDRDGGPGTGGSSGGDPRERTPA